jgi:quercetin dioxygenase-like cupin family protein
MPIIVKPEEMNIIQRGDGWTLTLLADSRTIGAPAMVARRWTLDPYARGPELVHGRAEGMLYVIGGDGVAHVEGQDMPLCRESVVWLETDERYQLEAGPQGLEVLQGYAPGQ